MLVLVDARGLLAELLRLNDAEVAQIGNGQIQDAEKHHLPL